MAQFARPNSTISTANMISGRDSHTLIDEATASDADSIASVNNTSATWSGGLSAVSDPSSSTGHVLRFRYAKVNNGTPDSGGSNGTLSVSLRDSSNLAIAATSDIAVSVGTWTTATLTLTPTEADSITDYSTLRVQFVFTGGSGSPANRRGVAVSWAEFEVPDVPVPDSFEQAAFRGHNDDGTHLGGTWKAASNTSWNQPVMENFRIRVVINKVAGTGTSQLFQWQYRYDGGAWGAVGDFNGELRRASSSYVNDGDATFNRLAEGLGTHVNGTTVSAGGSTIPNTAFASGGNQHTEQEIVLFVPDTTPGNKTIELRLIEGDGTPFTTYSNLASFIVQGGELFARTVGDTITSVTDSLSRAAANKARTVADSLTLSESVGRISNKLRTAVDSITAVSEAVVRVLIKPRIASDATSVTDSVVRTANKIRSVGDSITTATDSVVRSAANKLRSASDTVTTVTDSLVRGAIIKVRTAAENLVTSDSVARVSNKIRTLGDSVSGVTDSVAKVVSQLRTVADATVVTDALARSINTIRSAVDSTSVSDLIARVTSGFRWTEDDVSLLSDSISRSANMARSAVENIAIGVDTILSSTALVIYRTAADVVGIGADAVARTLQMGRNISDSTSVSDTVGKLISAVRSAADSITTSDAAARTVSILRTVTDVTALSESVSRAALTLTRTVSDATASVSDAVIRVSNKVRTALDTLIVSDVVQRSWSGARQAIDTLPGIVDNVVTSASIIIYRTAVDTLNVVEDFVSRGANMTRSVVDAVTTSDALQRMGLYARTATDSVGTVTDLVVRGGVVVRLFAEDVVGIVSDAITFFKGAPKYTGEVIRWIARANRWTVGKDNPSSIAGGTNTIRVTGEDNKEIVK